MIACPECGQQNPEGFRFCGACASPLAAQDEPAREVRKTVTVVFCDMAGSTQFADRSDPERVRARMGRYHDLARRVLESHGATVEKFLLPNARVILHVVPKGQTKTETDAKTKTTTKATPPTTETKKAGAK